MGNTTHSDSIAIEAYDGDTTTYVGPYNIKSKYLKIDPSAIGKNITIKSNGAYQAYYLMEYSKQTTFKFFGDTRAKTYTCTLPDNADKYLFHCYGNENACFYEISISN